MNDQPDQTQPLPWPTLAGVAALIAASIVWAFVYLMINQGPDSITNSAAVATFVLRWLPLLGLVSGLIGVVGGIPSKNWFACTCGAIGLFASGALLVLLPM